VVIRFWAFSASPCPGGVTQSHLGRRVDGAQVVIKSSVSLREDQHAFAKALVAVSAVLQQGLVAVRKDDVSAVSPFA